VTAGDVVMQRAAFAQRNAPKRLPPLTTFATRLMWTSLSTNSLSRSSRSLLRSRPPRSRSPAMVFSNLYGADAPVLVNLQNG
jgi:hypothetical protein